MLNNLPLIVISHPFHKECNTLSIGTNIGEKVKKKAFAQSLEDMAILSMQQYLSAKHIRRKERLYQNALVPHMKIYTQLIIVNLMLVSNY